MESEQKINEVKERHSMEFLDIPGVVGVGVERDNSGQFVLVLHVETNDPGLLSRLPRQVEGYPVRVINTGRYEKFSPTDE